MRREKKRGEWEWEWEFCMEINFFISFLKCEIVIDM